MNFAMKENVTATAPNTLKEHNKLGRFSAGQYSAIIPPLANSTPAGVNHQWNNCGSMASFSNSNPFASSTDSTLPTPEPVRRAIPARRNILEKSMHNLPAGFKVARIYHNSIEGTPKKVGRLVATNKNGSVQQNSANVSLLSASFRLPGSPSLRSNTSKSRTNVVCPSTPENFAAKWHKVLTPVRTYTRNSKNPVLVKRPTNVDSAKKFAKPYKPTYLINPTKGLDAIQKMEIRQRKLILDKKICISPKTFKKQQQQVQQVEMTKPKINNLNSLSFHKPRNYTDSLAMSAFDLLTNSNRYVRMNKKLNELFRKGCVNKASSTYSKYKLLIGIPPLQQDEQVLEISRMSEMEARNQRIERPVNNK
ncbi:univalents only isoform 2-T2 [Cochliomyia hominivorax]